MTGSPDSLWSPYLAPKCRFHHDLPQEVLSHTWIRDQGASLLDQGITLRAPMLNSSGAISDIRM
jgi:hypothetical protein